MQDIMKKYFNLKGFLRGIGLVNALVAIDIYYFWYKFYAGKLFDIDELASLLPNFEGYYAWEVSFTIPDLITAFFMFVAGVFLLFSPFNKNWRFVLTLTSGAILFLGVLDFNYSINNGMYLLPIDFSKDLLAAGVGLPVLAIMNITLLWLVNKR